jgi:hypothetical protein
MKTLPAICAAVALTTLAPRCPAASDRALMDGVAAWVNGRVITIGDVLAAIQPVQQKLRVEFEGDALKDKLRAAYADGVRSLVEERLILDAYEKGEQKLPDWVVAERVEKVIHDMFGGDRGKFLEALARDGLTQDEWRREVRDHIAAGYMRAGRVDRNVRLAPGRVRGMYARDPAAYRRPEKVRLGMIVVSGSGADGAEGARRRAEAILQRLKAGEDFAKVAAERSEGDKASEGGDLGWVEPDMLRPELCEAARRLRTGETSGVVAAGGDLYILAARERQDSATVPLSEARDRIEEQIRRGESERLYSRWIESLKLTSYVRVAGGNLFDL